MTLEHLVKSWLVVKFEHTVRDTCNHEVKKEFLFDEFGS